MTSRIGRRIAPLVAALAEATPMAIAVPPVGPLAPLIGASTRASSEFAAGWEGFHTYAQMVADIQAVQAAHPDMVGCSRSAPATRAASCGRPR
jgi:hypothetical protein